MAQLKGGTVSDFAGSMAEAMEQALAREWQALKGADLPAEGRDDRRLLFAAIATGVLSYLKAHQAEVLNTITLEIGGAQAPHAVTNLDLNIPAP